MSTRDPVELVWWPLATTSRSLIRTGHRLFGARRSDVAAALWILATACDLSTATGWAAGWSLVWCALMAFNLWASFNRPTTATGPEADHADPVTKVIWGSLWIVTSLQVVGVVLISGWADDTALPTALMATAMGVANRGDSDGGDPVLRRAVRVIRRALTPIGVPA